MKLHSQLVEKLLNLVNTFSGHKDDSKLRKMFQELDLTVYTRENGQNILVDTEEYNKKVEEAKRNQ